jgi:2-oxoglutarate dehydrogenase complex dehydrogenase (E1) component-like enzyme
MPYVIFMVSGTVLDTMKIHRQMEMIFQRHREMCESGVGINWGTV